MRGPRDPPRPDSTDIHGNGSNFMAGASEGASPGEALSASCTARKITTWRRKKWIFCEHEWISGRG